LRLLWHPILKRLSVVLAQSELDAQRLRDLGCAHVSVGGNLKFDVRSGTDSAAVRLIEGLRGELRLVVAGSTLEGEEAALLEAWPEMLAADAKIAMVMAPRHPERFGVVAELLARSGLAWRRRSEMGTAMLRPGEIVLLDSMGELATVYSMAAVAFVGGSLVPAGGHNPLEPAQFGVPVVMGEHYANFRSMVWLMRDRHALRITPRENFGAAMAAILRDAEEAGRIGQRGREVFEEESGATRRTVEALREVLVARR
jgi:3-deoxy-D-manno-octulosonic-acid transferase